jgi:3-oxoacyl-[acyl-carrier protein] reductase
VLLINQGFRSFTERVALVTNGAGGIGRAVALQLALQGAYVIVAYSPDEETDESVAGELQRIGTLANSIRVDLSIASEIERMFKEVESMFGRLDLLVNVTSLFPHLSLKGLTEDMWDKILDRNLKSIFLSTKMGMHLMRSRPSAAIVNVVIESSSKEDSVGVAQVATQAGVVGITKALANELSPHIRINCVLVKSFNADRLDNSLKRIEIPLSRDPTPDEVARACTYLLSSEAASITGQTLTVGKE